MINPIHSLSTKIILSTYLNQAGGMDRGVEAEPSIKSLIHEETRTTDPQAQNISCTVFSRF